MNAPPNILHRLLLLCAALALVALLPRTTLAEEGVPQVDYEEVYFTRMGDTASTHTLSLIASLGKPDSGWVSSGEGVYYHDLAVGKRHYPEPTHVLRVHARICDAKGHMIGDTVAFREPQRYLMGGKLLPEGFEQALATMRVGGRRLIGVTKESDMDFEVIVFPYHRGRPQKGDTVFYEITLLDAKPDELRKAVRFQ